MKWFLFKQTALPFPDLLKREVFLHKHHVRTHRAVANCLVHHQTYIPARYQGLRHYNGHHLSCPIYYKPNISSERTSYTPLRDDITIENNLSLT